MQPKHQVAAEKERTREISVAIATEKKLLKAVHKQLYRRGIREYAAESEEATAAMEKAWHLRVCECHASHKVKRAFCKVCPENHTVQNTVEILSHEMYAAKRRQAAQESSGKERMHLSFSASQTDASKAEESCTNGCILSLRASQKSNGCIRAAAKLQTKLTCSKQSTSGCKQRRSNMDEARGEKATQCGQQQACILSGGVYLRHRLKK